MGNIERKRKIKTLATTKDSEFMQFRAFLQELELAKGILPTIYKEKVGLDIEQIDPEAKFKK